MAQVDIIEESQALEVAKRVARAGKAVTIRDRPAIVALVRRTFGRLFRYEVLHEQEGGEAGANLMRMGNPGSSYSR